MSNRDVRPGASRLHRFGVFEVDCSSGELRKSGARVALQPQPFRVLARLLETPGRVVTRDELRRELWATDTFVDFEHSVNVAVARVREALGDDAERPRFVETLPRRGYRFVAPVEAIAGDATPTRHFAAGLWAALILAAVGGSTLAVMSMRRPPLLNEQDTLVVADFVNTTGDPTFNGALRLALMVQLEQSPRLSVVSRDRTAAILQEMTRPSDEEIVGSVAREVCQRAGAKVLVNGSIAPLGEHYVVGLEALDCVAGASFAHVQAEVPRREQVLTALGSSASRLRGRLGESIATIRRFDTPLEQATTPSLDALKAFSVAEDLFLRAGRAKEAAPFLERAIDLDSNFAMAYARLSAVSASLGRWDDETRYAQAAYARRDRATERERFYIDSRHCVTEPARVAPDCWVTVWNLWKRTYPRDGLPYANLAGSYASRGHYEEALENGLEAIRLNPERGLGYLNAVDSYIALDRYAEAKRLLDAAQARHLFEDWFHVERFQLAFIAGDEAAMEEERRAVSGRPIEGVLAFDDAEAAAFRGQLRRARILRDHASQVGRAGEARLLAARGAMFEAAVGLPVRIPDLSNAPRRGASIVRYIFAAAAALSGDSQNASVLLGSDEVPPQSLPLVEACRAHLSAESAGGSRAEAIVMSSSSPMGQFMGFQPTYLRGVTYLRVGNGARAAAEFRRIIEHRGVDPTSPLYPLAYVGRARAHVREGDFVQARRDYETFFALWADADPDVPILREAKAEYAKVGGADRLKEARR